MAVTHRVYYALCLITWDPVVQAFIDHKGNSCIFHEGEEILWSKVPLAQIHWLPERLGFEKWKRHAHLLTRNNFSHSGLLGVFCSKFCDITIRLAYTACIRLHLAFLKLISYSFRHLFRKIHVYDNTPGDKHLTCQIKRTETKQLFLKELCNCKQTDPLNNSFKPTTTQLGSLGLRLGLFVLYIYLHFD